jgi:hypothetical protein
MKNFLLSILVMSTLLSCSKTDVNGGKCYANDLTFKESKVNNLASVNSLIVTFDVKNNAKVDYDLTKNGIGNFVYSKIMVKTTDGTTYETKNIFIGNLSAGATASHDVLGTYGAGKTFQSYTMSLYCQ